jgi:hypothetical protein
MKTGVELIAAERERQKAVEGWTPEHDAQHTNGEMAVAAASYALGDSTLWPWSWAWYKPKERLDDLVRAGALIAAEIDRIHLLMVEKGEVEA